MTVHFIGAGPGAADLLTLRAVRLIGESQVCLYAGTYIGAEVLAHCPEGADARRHAAPRPRRDHRALRPRARGRATTSPGCAPATRRSTPPSPSRPAGSTAPGCRGT